MINLIIACDHAGWLLKTNIIAKIKSSFDIRDFGCHSDSSVNYALYAQKIASYILDYPDNMGILICGTGIGMSIAANRYKGIRAALCCNVNVARLSREHNNANVLCLGAKEVSSEVALQIIDVFVNTQFFGGRHVDRLAAIDRI